MSKKVMLGMGVIAVGIVVFFGVGRDTQGANTPKSTPSLREVKITNALNYDEQTLLVPTNNPSGAAISGDESSYTQHTRFSSTSTGHKSCARLRCIEQ